MTFDGPQRARIRIYGPGPGGPQLVREIITTGLTGNWPWRRMHEDPELYAYPELLCQLFGIPLDYSGLPQLTRQWPHVLVLAEWSETRRRGVYYSCPTYGHIEIEAL